MFPLALIRTQCCDPPIEALPQESRSYVPTHRPIRQTNPEKSSGGACTSRWFAAQRDGHCAEREHSRDAGSDGTCLAPRRSRAAKLFGIRPSYPGPCRLLSAPGKQQVCCRFGTFGPDKRRASRISSARESFQKFICAGYPRVQATPRFPR